MNKSGERTTLYDLKLLVECCYYAGADNVVYITDGFDSAAARLERAGLIERNPQDRHQARITRSAGENTVWTLIAQLGAISKRLTRQAKKRKIPSTR